MRSPVSILFAAALVLAALCPASRALADDRIVLFADRDDDDTNAIPDAEQPAVPSSPELFSLPLPPKGGGTFTLRGQGFPHVSFYPATGGNSFGGTYFADRAENLSNSQAEPRRPRPESPAPKEPLTLRATSPTPGTHFTARLSVDGTQRDFTGTTPAELTLDCRQLSGVVESAMDTVRPASEAKQVRLECVIDSQDLVQGDPGRLLQIVTNLLGNAVKFTQQGGWVRVHLRRVGTSLELSVTDNGQGITPAFLPHVFDKFRQADSGMTRTHGGLGLGLAIVAHLVELHGGTIAAHSEGSGKGAVFTMRLPLTAVAPAAPAPAPVHEARDPDEGQIMRVLVADDHATNRRVVEMIMAIAGGALVVVQGWLADLYGLQASFWLTAACELFVLIYALWGSRPTHALPPEQAL